jgi:hypothetical protein
MDAMSPKPGRHHDDSRHAADELFAELSRIDRAPEDLTARVMGRMGYRRVTATEAARRRRGRLLVRVSAAVLSVAGLTAATVHLQRHERRPSDVVRVDAAVVSDLSEVRSRVGSAWDGLRKITSAGSREADADPTRPERPGTPASILVGIEVDPAEPVESAPAFPNPWSRPAAMIEIEPALVPPTPRLGPWSFPSGGRGIERFGVPMMPPPSDVVPVDREDSWIGPLTCRPVRRPGSEPWA